MAWTISAMNKTLYFNFNTNLQGTKRKGSKLAGLKIRKMFSSPVEFFRRKNKLRKSLHKDVLYAAGKIIFQIFIRGVVAGLQLGNKSYVLKHLSAYFACITSIFRSQFSLWSLLNIKSLEGILCHGTHGTHWRQQNFLFDVKFLLKVPINGGRGF